MIRRGLAGGMVDGPGGIDCYADRRRHCRLSGRKGSETDLVRRHRRSYRRYGRLVDRLMGMVESTGVLDALLAAEDLSFDWHGSAVSWAVGHEVFRKAIGSINLPRRLKGRILGG